MGAETISLSSGEHYIILPGCDGVIQSVKIKNKWTAKNGNKYEPHGCLPKGDKISAHAMRYFIQIMLPNVILFQKSDALYVIFLLCDMFGCSI